MARLCLRPGDVLHPPTFRRRRRYRRQPTRLPVWEHVVHGLDARRLPFSDRQSTHRFSRITGCGYGILYAHFGQHNYHHFSQWQVEKHRICYLRRRQSAGLRRGTCSRRGVCQLRQLAYRILVSRLSYYLFNYLSMRCGRSLIANE